jgi:hypothetical protein
MRRALILLSFAIILLVAAAHVYRDPRVQDLFRSVPKAVLRETIVVPPSLPEQPPMGVSPPPPRLWQKHVPPQGEVDPLA